MYVSESALTGETGRTLEQLRGTFPLLTFERTDMASADRDGIVIGWRVSDQGAGEQFSGLPRAAAIRRLTEALATRGRGPYAAYHNRAFAADILERIDGG